MKKLEWDSKFWSLNIFNYEFDHNNKLKLPDEDSYIIQSLCNIEDTDSINILEEEGFSFVESKITLQKKICDKGSFSQIGFQALSVEQLNILKNRSIFYELFGMNSRFNVFPNEKVNDFYYTWMVNSLDKKMDDYCIGYFVDSRLAGFITYRIRDLITIGLLGVIPDFQGKGVSQLLLNYVEGMASKTDANTISISTQGTNIKAINAYIKNGYTIHSIDHWYYFTKGVFQ